MADKTGITIVLLLVLLTGCGFLENTEEKQPIARVNNSYLYHEDIEDLVTDETSEEDSALIVSSYIKRWATQQLLIDRAKVNISLEKQEEFEKLVENYRNTLYAKAYTDAMVARELDTVISQEEAREYYEEFGKNFKLNEDLVKIRYINLTKENQDIERIAKMFKRFKPKDRKDLLDMAIQFKSYSFNDSVWVSTREVFEKITLLSPEEDMDLLKKEDFLQLEDSLEVYLVAVEDIKLRNEKPPLEYILPTIEQILLNQRKLELIKELEKDITKDAIKNEEFEIYK